MTIDITVYGEPGPQGSKRHVGRGIMVESSKKVKPWREAVAWAAREVMAGRPPLTHGIVADFVFSLRAPKKRRNAYPYTRPDLDKLARSTCDALTSAGVWADDSLVVDMRLAKRYAGDVGALNLPGARLIIKEIER